RAPDRHGRRRPDRFSGAAGGPGLGRGAAAGTDHRTIARARGPSGEEAGMHRRVGTSLALVVSTLAFVAGCSGTSGEQKLLSDFFRAARLRDSATLGNFATASFEPRTDGVVESFTITSMTETSAPLALKQYAKAIDDAKAADV